MDNYEYWSIFRGGVILCAIRRRRFLNRINQHRQREEDLVVKEFASDKNELLTDDEKQQVNELWGQLMPITSYKEYEMFKKQFGFDARFVSHHIYLPILARRLNNYKYTKLFDDKGMLGYISSSNLKFPFCYVRCIGGDLFDNEMRQINLTEAIHRCASLNAVFIKPSKETSGGKGTEVLRMEYLTQSERCTLIAKKISERNNDFVIQECLSQHRVMAQFNASSVNTLRITTLLLNGVCSICSIILRMGKDASSVDNWGGGGIVCHVDFDGNISDIGIDIHLNRYNTNGTCIFQGKNIPQVPMILKQIKDAHTNYFALCNLIGWDVAINQEGEAVILELNSSQPGLIAEQIFSGPIFGERTQEVIEYCKNKPLIF